ncbi:MAG: TAXI family TRAP transporter solute-binding subunit [Desulfurococcales archaeon]|nr:TAXI family TRAP transporter solute-binding subunit [Desulfurococcales archaeon]
MRNRNRRGLSTGAWIGIAIVIIIIIVAAALMMGGGGKTTTTSSTPAGTTTSTGGGQTTTSQKKVHLTLYTGSQGGVYYPVGFAIAKAVTQYSGYIQVTAQESGASVANAKAIKSGDADFAIMQGDVAYFAYNGIMLPDFKGKPIKSLRAVAALHPEPVQIVARADSGINTVWDLAGHTVAVGNEGSGLYATAYTILSALGLWDKINKQLLGYKDAGDQIRSGAVEAFINVAGIPTPFVEELAAQVKLKLVAFPDDAIQKLKDAGLGNVYTPYIVPAGSYSFQKEDVQTVTTKAQLVTRASTPDQVVYDFLKAMFSPQGLEIIHKAHKRAADITLENAVKGLAIPVHPGAKKFYEDKGVWPQG